MPLDLSAQDSADQDWELGPKPLIITVALTGAVPQKSKYSNLPVDPEEIALSAIDCANHGASIFHLHMRDEFGQQTQDLERLLNTIQLIRAEVPDAIICATTTSRGSKGIQDRLTPFELPKEHLPELASLTMGSYNTPYGVNLNPMDEIVILAEKMIQSGVSPELEIFEAGMLYSAHRMIDQGKISRPAIINILLGVEGACAANERELRHLVGLVPLDVEWAVAGIGKYQREMVELGVKLNGNVRVGMEDNPRGYHSDWTNLDSVKMAADLAASAGREIETRVGARKRLGLK